MLQLNAKKAGRRTDLDVLCQLLPSRLKNAVHPTQYRADLGNTIPSPACRYDGVGVAKYGLDEVGGDEAVLHVRHPREIA
jgi:hypothetical protein